jgi:hypothetical protein
MANAFPRRAFCHPCHFREDFCSNCIRISIFNRIRIYKIKQYQYLDS